MIREITIEKIWIIFEWHWAFGLQSVMSSTGEIPRRKRKQKVRTLPPPLSGIWDAGRQSAACIRVAKCSRK
jgi:hypothetical protein